jgi:hypothetical protein
MPNIEQFKELVAEIATAALDLYARRYALNTEFRGCLMVPPTQLEYHGMDTTDVILRDLNGDFEHVSLDDLQDPETSLANLRHDLIKAKEEREARMAAKYDRRKAEAIAKIAELKKEFDL